MMEDLLYKCEHLMPLEIKCRYALQHYYSHGNHSPIIRKYVRRAKIIRPDNWRDALPESVRDIEMFTVYRGGIGSIERAPLSILRIETNRFASANLEYKLVMVDDDLNMVALPETRNIKSIVTAEDRLCIERKNKQAVQGLLYVRFICFGNGNLVAAHDDSDGFWRRQILITVKDRDPARVDNPFLIEELSEERPGILLWMLEGLHRLLANRYQFTISERSIQNLEAAMADSDNLTQFMQATAYVRFKPDTEERSTYLYRAYTKWCEDNLESPVPQKKFSQFLLKNAGKYGLTFSKHIEGKYRGFRGVCVHPAFAAA